MKKKKIIITLTILLLLTITISVTAVKVYRAYFKTSFQSTLDGKESSAILSNPYCGWYQLYGYLLMDTDMSQSIVTNTKNYIKVNDDNRLVLIEINLKNFSNEKISDTGLAQLEQIFSLWSNSNASMIVRFLYDWDGKAMQTEPLDINTIYEHMDQVSTVVNTYKNSIYLLQGIFVGNCGEMNNSNYMSEENMRNLMVHLAEKIDPEIYLSVRTPSHWRMIEQSLSINSAMVNGTNASRIGLFNDGMLGSGNDLGTYGDGFLTGATDYHVKGTRSEEIDYQNTLCNFVPNGGEVVLDNPYNDFEPAIKDLSQMHISYLNEFYDMNVFKKWKNAVYTADDVFSGCNGYDYVTAHLGYRYVLKDIIFDYKTLKSKVGYMTFSVENKGFSNAYKSFDVSVAVKNTNTGEIHSIAVNTDTKTWNSGETVYVTFPVDITTLGAGNYEAYLTVKDPVKDELIKFANASSPSQYGYQLGNLIITK
jgi:hypothetical protein